MPLLMAVTWTEVNMTRSAPPPGVLPSLPGAPTPFALTVHFGGSFLRDVIVIIKAATSKQRHPEPRTSTLVVQAKPIPNQVLPEL